MNTGTAGYACCGIRIAPVFDVSDTLIVRDRSAAESNKRLYIDPESGIAQRYELMKSHGIDTLICGAVSREYQDYLELKGIWVIPFLAGDVFEIQRAYEQGQALRTQFYMPGCRCLGKRNELPMRRRKQYAGFRRNRT